MRVKSLHVENFLTFDTFDLELDGTSHVIVGPNGAGKSNVVRVFDLVCKGLDSASQGFCNPVSIQAAEQILQSFAAAHHHNSSPDRPAVIGLGIELSTRSERERLTTFVRAGVLSTLLAEIGPSSDLPLILGQWVEAELNEVTLAPLFKGTILLEHVGMPHHPWDISYEFKFNNLNYRWLMGTRGFSHSVVQSTSISSGVENWPYKQLKETLLSVPQSTEPPITLPNPLPHFDFSLLCPSADDAIAAISIRLGSGGFDVQLRPCRRASELLGVPVIVTGQQAFPLAGVLAQLLDDGIIIIGEQFRGLGVGGMPPQQAGPYSWEVLVSPTRSRAPWLLPVRLFELKNGAPDQRQKYKEIQGKFCELAPGRWFDVKFQARDLQALNPATIGTGQVTLFAQGASQGQQVEPPPPNPGASVTVVVDRTSDDGRHPSDLPIQLHGGGTWEALVVAEALVESRDKFVLLDEPALTLHPTWQRALRTSIEKAPGSFMVITHSANLVPVDTPEGLAQLVRIDNESGSSMVHRLPTLTSDDTSRIIREFALSSDAVSLLFARGVVLVEGETELGALPRWFDNPADSATPGPDALDLAFYSVGGDTNFRTLITVLHAFAIPWVLVCDGAAFDITKRMKRRPHIFDQVLKAGVQSPELEKYLGALDPIPTKRIMDQSVFEEQRTLGATQGIFTLACGWKTENKATGALNDESFEAFIEAVAPEKLDEAEAAVGDSKVRKGLWLAEKVPCPSKVTDLYTCIVTILQARGLAHNSSQQSTQ